MFPITCSGLPVALIVLALLLPFRTMLLPVAVCSRTRHCESDSDNRDLPIGPRIAIIVSGLCKKGVFEHVIRTLQTNVVDAIGRDQVHLFFHLESRGPLSSAEVKDTLVQNVHPSNLRTYAINDNSAIEPNAPHTRIQFDRLRAGFQLVLVEERLFNERYRWICRVRTDTFWLAKWNGQMLSKLVPQTSIVDGNKISKHE